MSLFTQPHTPLRASGNTQPLVGRVYVALLELALIGIIILSVSQQFGRTTISALMFSLAFFLLGGLLGFLFGIPRTFARLSSETEAVDVQEDAQRFLETNSNLVQVSDWLTKILVGVALVQLGSLPGMLGSFGDYAEGAFGYDAHLATASMLFFSIDGFLVGYLATRLILQNAFSSIERNLIEEVGAVRQKLDNYQENQAQRDERDYEAITAVHGYLATERSPTRNETKDLSTLIRQASAQSRALIYGIAREKRRAASGGEKQILLRRTVDIFNVLLDLDATHYRVCAELGYAYKDLKPPENEQAEQMLSQAIKFRGDDTPNRYIAFEFNRAIVRMRLNRELSISPLNFE